MKTRLDVVIIIPFYNEELYIEPLITSLANQVHPTTLKWRALFVDNNSKDKTRRIISTLCAKYHIPYIIIDEPKKGTIFSRITGLKKASGLNPDIMISTDADVIIPPNFIEATYNDFIRQNVSVLCGKIHKPSMVTLWEKVMSKKIFNWNRKIRNLEYTLFGPYFFGSFFALKTEIYKSISLFEPDKHELFLGEDILLARRCYFIGASFGHSSLSITTHPRKYVALQSDVFIHQIGNNTLPHDSLYRQKDLVFQTLNTSKEAKITNRLFSFVTKRLAWSIADSYIFWEKTGRVHTNAYDSTKRGLRFFHIPLKELQRIGILLNQDIIYNTLLTSFSEKIMTKLKKYLYDTP